MQLYASQRRQHVKYDNQPDTSSDCTDITQDHSQSQHQKCGGWNHQLKMQKESQKGIAKQAKSATAMDAMYIKSKLKQFDHTLFLMRSFFLAGTAPKSSSSSSLESFALLAAASGMTISSSREVWLCPRHKTGTLVCYKLAWIAQCRNVLCSGGPEFLVHDVSLSDGCLWLQEATGSLMQDMPKTLLKLKIAVMLKVFTTAAPAFAGVSDLNKTSYNILHSTEGQFSLGHM